MVTSCSTIAQVSKPALENRRKRFGCDSNRTRMMKRFAVARDRAPALSYEVPFAAFGFRT